MSALAFISGCVILFTGMIYSTYQIVKVLTDIPNKMFEFLKIYAKANNIELNISGDPSKGLEFLEKNKDKKDVIELQSGLQYTIMTTGDGEKPKMNSKVTVHYKGSTIDGVVFDSSLDRGAPVEFKVNGVIKGWTEALQIMKVGSKWKIFIPSNLAYGEKGVGKSIPPNSVLIFEIELLNIEK